MTPSPSSRPGLQKAPGKLPITLRQALKVRCAQLGIGIQEAVAEAVTAWQSQSEALPRVPTESAASFSTWLPPGLHDSFRSACRERGVSYTQGLAQAVTLWLGDAAAFRQALPATTAIRTAVCHPRAGAGKTTLVARFAEILAGADLRVLLVDYDPEGRLTRSAGLPLVGLGQESLVTHMLDRRSTARPLADLVHDVPWHSPAGLVRLLPAAVDGYLLDSGLAVLREPRLAALERALAPLEADYDAVVLDCPSSLGMAVEAALYYTRQRGGLSSGIAVPVGFGAADPYRDLLVDLIRRLDDDWQTTLVHEEVRIADRVGRAVREPLWFPRRPGR